MATLKINGDTSGYVELVAKPVAGSTSIRLDKIVVANSSGDVGIGTDTPSSKLNLYDPTAAVLEVSAFNNWVGLVAGIENPPQIRWKQGWSLGFGPATHATGADPLNFNGTGYDNKMTISNGGNVGIGTNNPLNKFVVAEANDQHGVEIAPGTLSYIQAYDRATSDYGDLSIDAQSIRFATDNGTERMRIHTGGNVGIGTDNPHQTLHVNGGAADTTIQITNSASGSAATDGFSLTVENPSGDVNIRNREATNMRFYTSNAERMRIASNGMVQVGGVTNDSGGTKFKVGGSGNDGEITLHADTTASYITAYDRTAGLYHPIISTASEHQLNGGNVGIGRTTPQSKLEVWTGNGELSHFGSNNANADTNYTGITLGYAEAGANSNYRKVGIVSVGRGDGAARQDLAFLVDSNSDGNSVDLGDAKMRISHEGYVTTPNQPAFGVRGTNFNGTTFLGGTVFSNIGNHFSTTTGLFTAPVAGTYNFNFTLTTSDTQSHFVDLFKNGSSVFGHSLIYGVIYNTGSMTINVTLAAGDTMSAHKRGASYSTYNALFSGFLIG